MHKLILYPICSSLKKVTIADFHHDLVDSPDGAITSTKTPETNERLLANHKRSNSVSPNTATPILDVPVVEAAVSVSPVTDTPIPVVPVVEAAVSVSPGKDNTEVTSIPDDSSSDEAIVETTAANTYNESQPSESYDECDGPSYPEVESEGDCP